MLGLSNQIIPSLRKNTFFALLLAISIQTGCYSNRRPTAKVEGTVTYKGQPVRSGTIVFTPKERSKDDLYPGKAARGSVDADGRFRLSTYGTFDGAIVGPHLVTYLNGDSDSEEEPTDEMEEGKESVNKSKKKTPLNIGLPDDFIIEVKSKENNFEIELGAFRE